jgi:hypothetical protein
MFLGVLRRYLQNINAQNPAIPKSIKKGGVFSEFLKRVDFRARVEFAQTTWWE